MILILVHPDAATIDRRNWPLWIFFDIKRISLDLTHHESMYHGLYASITSFAQIDTLVDTVFVIVLLVFCILLEYVSEKTLYTIYSLNRELWMHAQN
jgi:hypothetical protein